MFLKLMIIAFFIISCCPTGLSDEYYKIISSEFDSVRFADDEHGWIAGHRGVFYTSDGGETWYRQPVSINSRWTSSARISIEEAGDIVWADQQSAIIRSENGLVVGDAITQQWQNLIIPKRILEHLRDISFLDRSEGWGVGPFGAIYKTEDGGKTWKKIPSPTEKHLQSIFPFSSTEVWICGGDGILMHTTNGGQSWTLDKLGGDADLYSLRFFNREKGWVCGTAGLVLHTSDGGKHWQRARMPYSSGTGLNAVSFVNADTGWLVGASWTYKDESNEADNKGAILYTKDGGQNWEIQTSGTKDILVDVCGLSNGKAWAVGLNGTVLRTADFGRNWTQIKLYQ